MAANYPPLIKRILDNTYQLSNASLLLPVEEVGSLTVTVYRLDNCNSNVWDVFIPQTIIQNQYNVVLVKNFTYKIVIKRLINNIQVIINETIISYYPDYLNQIVNSTNSLFCGCSCKDCDDCNEETDVELYNLISEMMSYLIMTNTYNNNLIVSNSCIKCDILEINLCIFANKSILGKSDNILLIKQLLAYYYLIMYYTDLKRDVNSVLTNTQYNFNVILKCLNKLNISEKCIKDVILNNGVSTTISGNGYIHTQVTPSTTWIINHNLGIEPNVTIFDTLGELSIGEIQHINTNILMLTFSQPLAGQAILS